MNAYGNDGKPGRHGDERSPRRPFWKAAKRAHSLELIHQTNYLIDQQLLRLENDFVEQGGLRERMTRVHIAHRNAKPNEPTPNTSPDSHNSHNSQDSQDSQPGTPGPAGGKR